MLTEALYGVRFGGALIKITNKTNKNQSDYVKGQSYQHEV